MLLKEFTYSIKFLIITSALVLCSNRINAQEVRVIDNKGTLKTINNNRVTSGVQPTLPLEGDVWFDTATNTSKIFDGTQWLIIDNDAVTTAATAPTTPVLGDIWFDITNPNNVLTNVWNGTAWNEIKGPITSLSLVANTLTYINEDNSNATIDLSPFLDNTDAQNLSHTVITPNEEIEIEISNGTNTTINIEDADADPANENQTVSAGNGITVNQTGQDYEVVNASPDQTVVLNSAGATTVTGTYPNFTISSTDNVNDADFDPTNENQTVSAGNGITVNQTGQDFEVVNASPDQTVVLNSAGATTVTGTYPNFTVSSTDNVNDADFDPTNENQTVSAGNGITVNQTGQDFEVVNASPDQTVVLNSAGATTVTGTYPNFTISSTDDQKVDVYALNADAKNLDLSLERDAEATRQVDLSGLAISGDVTGTLASSTVEKIQNVDVSSTAPINGQVMTYNGTSTQWEAATSPATVYTGFFIINAPGGSTATTFNQIISGLPFEPSQITFVAHANVESTDIDNRNTVGVNAIGISNSFGTMNGFARNDGTSPASQQVIFVGGSGNFMNSISRYASSSQCIGLRYANQDGLNLGKITASLTSFDSNGFTLSVSYSLGSVTSLLPFNPLLNVAPDDVLDESLVVLYTAYR